MCCFGETSLLHCFVGGHLFSVTEVMLSQKKRRKERLCFGNKKFGPDERMAFPAGKESVTCHVVLSVLIIATSDTNAKINTDTNTNTSDTNAKINKNTNTDTIDARGHSTKKKF